METPVACFTRFGAFPRGTVRNALRIFDSLGRNPGEVPPRENNPPDCFLSPLLRLLTLLSSWDSVPHPASLLKEGKYVLQTYSENFPPPTARTCASLSHRRGVSRRSKARMKSSVPAFSRKNSVPGGISCQRGPQIRFSHPSSAASAAVRDSKVLCLLSFKKVGWHTEGVSLHVFPVWERRERRDVSLCPTTPTGWNLPGK